MSTDALKSLNDQKLLELRKEIGTLKEALQQTQNEMEIAYIKKKLFDLELYYNILLERRSSK